MKRAAYAVVLAVSLVGNVFIYREGRRAVNVALKATDVARECVDGLDGVPDAIHGRAPTCEVQP